MSRAEETRGVRVFYWERPRRVFLAVPMVGMLATTTFVAAWVVVAPHQALGDRLIGLTFSAICAWATWYWITEAILLPIGCEGQVTRLQPGGPARHPDQSRWWLECAGRTLRIRFREPFDLGATLKVGDQVIVRYWRASKNVAEIRVLR